MDTAGAVPHPGDMDVAVPHLVWINTLPGGLKQLVLQQRRWNRSLKTGIPPTLPRPIAQPHGGETEEAQQYQEMTTVDHAPSLVSMCREPIFRQGGGAQIIDLADA